MWRSGLRSFVHASRGVPRTARVVTAAATVGVSTAAWVTVSAAAPPAPPPPPPPRPAPVVVEPYSKTAFDAVLGKLRLAGVGLRTKYSYFHVYAYALYVDGAGANKLSSLTAQKDYFAGLVSEPFAKRLELVFLRDITGADMREAFVVSLGPRTNDTAALTAFFAQFDGLQLKAGTRMSFDFAYSKEGCQLTSAFQGQPLGTIASASLARALLDVYLGDAPVSADIKPSVWERREAAV